MNEFEQLLNDSRIACQQALSSKKLVLERLSELLTNDLPELDANEILDAFIVRERLGSTDLGHGVALPHVRHEGIVQPRAAFVQLSRAVEFDPIKHSDVDLIVALIVPEEAHDVHLQLLSQLARILSQAECRHRLRQAVSADDILKIMEHYHEQ